MTARSPARGAAAPLAVLALVALASLLPAGPAAAAEAAAAPRARLSLLPTGSQLVAFRLLFRTGSVDDPPGKEGLAALTAAMVAEGGSAELPYTEVLRRLYPMAAQVRADADKEVTVIRGEVHRDHLGEFYRILRSLVVTPRFDPEDFARLKADAVNYLTTTLRSSDDEELGKWTLQLALYEGHPYGHVDQGTRAGLESITLDDVRAFHRGHYTLDRLTVGIAGGYPEGFPAQVAEDLGALPERGTDPVTLPPPPRRPGRRVTLVQKEARATAISWGFSIDLTRGDADFFALLVASSYLGEHRTFNGLLMNQLRGTRGLNYGDYCYIESFLQDGWSTFARPNIPRRQQYFSVWLRPVKPENAVFALRASLHYLEELVARGIPERGFRDTRDFLLGYSRLWAQSTSRRLGYQLDSEWYGRQDFLEEIQKRLRRLTAQDVDRAIDEYLKPASLEIAMVTGDAEGLRGELLRAGPTPIRYDTEGTPPEVLEEDKVLESHPLGIEADGIRIVPVAEMFER